ncbi:MAG: tRNA uridine-5-carboxymethylaminomethyl(34) synthesis GTPase MnmE [Nitrospiraceae bacterium]|nr:tRNA uridine-5-carboxymethylaminomethyl(34) synthesis GTPase MnmE [Nitrospiraceae bacterium]|tara:strand:+ start:4252 stop:5649 length:1398 start_codon:yes stop_codon:yes gene_type:complete
MYIFDHIGDTICAISTASGEGAIGIIRVSGPKTIEILGQLFLSKRRRYHKQWKSYVMYLGRIENPDSRTLVDEVMLMIMRAPRTYTREDMAEIHCHGSPLVLHHVLELLVQHGAVLAEPGEFTKRAFLNGRIDLVQAEAVIDIIRSRSSGGLDAALHQLEGKLSQPIMQIRDDLVQMLAHIEAGIDFVDEDITFVTSAECVGGIKVSIAALQALIDTADEGRILRDGLATAIIGRPNVGKSSLLNALTQSDRAIVTPLPGTTRDVLEEFLNIRGIPIKLLDTAGIRHSRDIAEQEGVRRTYRALDQAEFILVVLDGSVALEVQDWEFLRQLQGKQHLIVLNKVDLGTRISVDELEQQHASGSIVSISATTGRGLEDLKDAIKKVILNTTRQLDDSVIVTQVRHKNALCNARDALELVLGSIDNQQPGECLALDLRVAIDALGEIVGVTTTDDILGQIFGKFCIGK